jgi:Family of unknown function (DUF6338)
MPPDSLLALGILLVAVLPGAIYTWAFEREAGPYGVTLADRVLRFVAGSTVMHLVLGWPEYLVFRLAIEGRERILAGQFAVLWLGLLVLAALPAAAGTVLGELYATRTARTGWRGLRRWLTANQERRLLRFLLGRDPAPRAWDDLFSEQLQCYLRVRTTGDRWLAGKFAGASYAAGYPDQPDLLMEEAYEVDQETGLLGRGLGYPLYIAAGQIAWVEVVWPSDDERDATEQVGPSDDAPVDSGK